MKLFLLKKNPGPGMSKRMFDKVREVTGVPVEYDNLVTPVDYYDKVMKKMKTDKAVLGFNVTIPYKVDILDEVEPDEDVSACGAVNCVRVDHEEEVFYGHNTDWKGIVKPVEKMAVRSAVIAGAGGAARAACYAMTKMGVEEIHVFNRTLSRAEALRKNFPAVKVHKLETIGDYLTQNRTDLLMNTTSLGMNPHPWSCIPVSAKHLKNVRTVFDIVYKPLKTKLLTFAEEAGCNVVNGLEMLVEQHIENVRIWGLPEQERIIEVLKSFKR